MIATTRTLRSLVRVHRYQHYYEYPPLLVRSIATHVVSSNLRHSHNEKHQRRQGLPVVACISTNSFLARNASSSSSFSLLNYHHEHYQHRWFSTGSREADHARTVPTDEEHYEDNEHRDRSLRRRAAEYQERARQRAGEMRESAVEQYHEFRQHPKETAKKSAHTMGGMIKLYGPVFLWTYGTVYFSTLGLFFLGVESGALDPAVMFGWLGMGGGEGEEAKNTVHLVVEFMEDHNFLQPYAPFIEKNPSVANLAVAWIAVKFTEPVRFALTLGITPRVARYLGWTVRAEEEEAGNESNPKQPNEIESTDFQKVDDPVATKDSESTSKTSQS